MVGHWGHVNGARTIQQGSSKPRVPPVPREAPGKQVVQTITSANDMLVGVQCSDKQELDVDSGVPRHATGHTGHV